MKYDGFYNRDQADNYLRGSVVRVGTTPAYITGVRWGRRNERGENRETVSYESLLNHRRRNILLKSTRLNLAPVPLGYIDYGNGASLIVTRVPTRNWKMGLSQSNMKVMDHRQCEVDRPRNIIRSTELGNTIINKFDSVERARATLKMAGGIKAFDREFAIDSYDDLWYVNHNEPVGKMGNEPDLLPQFNFLAEKLKEVLDARKG